MRCVFNIPIIVIICMLSLYSKQLDCFCYLSNKITLLSRQCISKYYACWLVCDDRTCGRRTTQQSVRGAVCTAEHCQGRMIQEYSEKDLHTQMKYLESLVDVPRYLSRKKNGNAADGGNGNTDALVKAEGVGNSMVGAPLPGDKYTLDILKTHMSNTIMWSAYNWIRPSLWSTMFTAATAKVKKEK